MAQYFHDFKDILNNIKDPLENIDFYRLLLNNDDWLDKGLSNTDITFENFHYVYILNLFKSGIKEHLRNVTKMSDAEFIEEYQDLLVDCSKETYMEALSKILGITDSKKLFSAISKYSKVLEKVLGLKVGTWFYYSSQNLNPGLANKITSENMGHILYLSIDAKERCDLADLLLKKSNEYSIPYIFKVATNNKHNNTIMIYLSSEDQVVEYVNILTEIFGESEYLTEHVFNVSPYLGVINEKIGYAFHPQKLNGMSYHELIYKICKEAYDNIYARLMKNLSIKSNYDSILEIAQKLENKINTPFPTHEKLADLYLEFQENGTMHYEVLQLIFLYCGDALFIELFKSEVKKIMKTKYNNIYNKEDNNLLCYGNNGINYSINPDAPKLQ